MYVGCSLNSKWNLLFHRSPYCKRLTSASATILLNFILSILFTSIIDGISILRININLMRARLLPPRQTAVFLMKSSEFMNIHAHPTHTSTPILFVQILLISVLQTHIFRLVLDIDRFSFSRIFQPHQMRSYTYVKSSHRPYSLIRYVRIFLHFVWLYHCLCVLMHGGMAYVHVISNS